MGSRMTFCKRIITTTLAAFLTLVGGLVAASPAHATGPGVDMTQACRLEHGPTWEAKLFYPSQGAYGWKCHIPPFSGTKDVNVNLYCDTYYGVWSHNHGGAYTWHCTI